MKISNYDCSLFIKSVVVLIVFTGCAFSGTEEDTSERSITLMTWNIHNLFDGKDNGYEYVEFLEAAGWSTEKYLGRINTISAAIEAINPKPDLIFFQEVESLLVLEDIAHSLSNGYNRSYFANNPEMAIGLGIISRIPLSDSRVHSITVEGETIPRPVLETRLDTDEGSFVIFACHWKSKLGGDAATEIVRRASARVILRRTRELWENEPELGIIVCGDLNENHDEFYRNDAGIICALMPDDIYCANLVKAGAVSALTGLSNSGITGLQKDFLIISGSNPPTPVHFPDDAIVFFSPWTQELENGSYFYKNNWETIDHFLVSPQFFNGKNWEYERANLANFQPFVNSGGTPFSYNARTGAGLSDHLPLLITVKAVSN